MTTRGIVYQRTFVAAISPLQMKQVNTPVYSRDALIVCKVQITFAAGLMSHVCMLASVSRALYIFLMFHLAICLFALPALFPFHFLCCFRLTAVSECSNCIFFFSVSLFLECLLHTPHLPLHCLAVLSFWLCVSLICHSLFLPFPCVCVPARVPLCLCTCSAFMAPLCCVSSHRVV